MILIYILSSLVALLAAISDIKSRTISNKFIIRSMLIGILFRSVLAVKLKDISIIRSGLIGFAFPYIALVLIYVLGAIGAADIKLLSVLGLLLGFKCVFSIIVYSFVFGGILGVLELLIFSRKRDYRLPFAVPILMALIYVILRNVN